MKSQQFSDSFVNELNLFLNNKKNKKQFINNFFKNYVAMPAVTKDYGGTGGSFKDIYLFNKNLALSTGNIGFTLTSLIHQIILKLINETGTSAQKENLLKDAVNKGIVFSFAVSEPETGPHPKYLKTKAEKNSAGYLINGSKTFITNAPVSDYTIVIAVTKETEIKHYSAFIIKTDEEGTDLKEFNDLPFFKDSFHGSLDLKNVVACSDAILGSPDSAYDDIVMKFRKYEDILMTGPVLGGIEYLMNNSFKGNISITDKDFFYKKGTLTAQIKSLDYLCIKACMELENNAGITEYIHLFMRQQIKTIVEQIQNLCKEFNITLADKEKEILNDLTKSGNIAFNAAYSKLIKLGKNEFF
jgi:acyl-CoA dehydrogenase